MNPLRIVSLLKIFLFDDDQVYALIKYDYTIKKRNNVKLLSNIAKVMNDSTLMDIVGKSTSYDLNDIRESEGLFTMMSNLPFIQILRFKYNSFRD